tara:strand:- start:6559 stop:6861 length:303 start_codon:yes stop_codon:yes gene_type:complete
VFQLFEQSIAAALGRPPAIRLHRNQHNRLTGGQSPHPMDHQERTSVMVTLQPLRHRHDLALTESGVMLEFKGLQWTAIHRRGSHTTNEQGTGSGITMPTG